MSMSLTVAVKRVYLSVKEWSAHHRIWSTAQEQQLFSTAPLNAKSHHPLRQHKLHEVSYIVNGFKARGTLKRLNRQAGIKMQINTQKITETRSNHTQSCYRGSCYKDKNGFISSNSILQLLLQMRKDYKDQDHLSRLCFNNILVTLYNYEQFSIESIQ